MVTDLQGQLDMANTDLGTANGMVMSIQRHVGHGKCRCALADAATAVTAVIRGVQGMGTMAGSRPMMTLADAA